MTTRNVWILYALAASLLAALAPDASAQYYKKKKTNDTDTKAPAREKTDQRKDLEDFRDEASEVLAPLARAPGASAGVDDERWSIVIIAFTGESQDERARQGLHKIVTQAGLTAARVETRDKATVIAYGSYAGPDDPEAGADLDRIRTMRINGGTPFATAILSPPAPEHLAGSLPELDLRNAKALFGKDKALYTLQVGIYGRGDRSPASREEIAEYRALAEQAAVMLRRDGELAFYYHAPERSMVTVGVFNQDDHDPLRTPPTDSFELIETKQRHPLNLLNGRGIREHYRQKDGSPATRMQPSVLVAVPDA